MPVACSLGCSTVGGVEDRRDGETKMQYEWAAGHLKNGLASLSIDSLDRDDIARWLEASAAEGQLS